MLVVVHIHHNFDGFFLCGGFSGALSPFFGGQSHCHFYCM